MKKTFLTGVIAFSLPGSGYQWGQNFALSGRTTNSGPGGLPSYIIPRLAKQYRRGYCPSADEESLSSGFHSGFGKVAERCIG